MTSSVFIRTFDQDIPWLDWTFKFLAKNWLSTSDFVVSAPNSCSEVLKAKQDILGREIKLAPLDQWSDRGYVFQQYVKHHADLYCQGDLITYIDSDAMLILPTDVEKDLCHESNPIIWYTEYARLDAPWQQLVTQVMAIEPPHEFMRCFPITYRRSTLKDCREHIERLHARSLHDFMSTVRSWTEFNILGFYAYVFERRNYHFEHTDKMFTKEGLESNSHCRVRQFHNVRDWNDVTRKRLHDMYESPDPLKFF